jgi:hypothetical protein
MLRNALVFTHSLQNKKERVETTSVRDIESAFEPIVGFS